MASRYTFADYSPDWPAKFLRERTRLESLLGDDLIAVYHIGSTSVPGLAAKPTIDLLPVVRTIQHVDTYEPRFVQAGYKVWGEYGLPGRRLFTKDFNDTRTHNIHVYQAGHPDVERHVAFCTYLRSHPDIRDEYSTLKREAYRNHPADIAAYNAFKNDWIRHIEVIAIEWMRRQDAASHEIG